MTTPAPPSPSIPQRDIGALLKKADITAARPAILTQLKHGRNNRVFRLDAGGRSFLLKTYFRHPGDPRDRQGAETAFLHFCARHGIACVPQLLAEERQAGCSLMSWIPGTAVPPGEVDADAVASAAAFLRRLAAAHSADARTFLAPAADACFSLRDHLALAQRKLHNLANCLRAQPADAPAAEALSFVQEELLPRLAAAGDALLEAVPAGELDRPLPEEARVPSPSDFGFHNALKMPEGTFVFVDFEYAGMDDPAKLLCDAVCQPDMPLPPGSMERLAAALAPDGSPALLARARLLLSLHRLKWCGIILNEFQVQEASRRQFAAGDADMKTARRRQLEKCRRYLRQTGGNACPA